MELYNEENTSPTILYSFAEQLDRGIAQGIEKGASLEKKNIAKKLIGEKMSLETIATVTGLSLEEVKAIQETPSEESP